jgi:hypothetical protein
MISLPNTSGWRKPIWYVDNPPAEEPSNAVCSGPVFVRNRLSMYGFNSRTMKSS